VKRLAVVIAAYDERDNVEPLVRRLRATLDALAGWEWELIFVVEGADGTREALERLAPEVRRLRVLYQARPAGIGDAFRRGFAAVPADADFVVTLDADLNHQPEEIPRLLAAAERRGCDVLVGSRFVAGARVDGTPAWKRLLSTTVNRLMRHLYGLQVADKTSGFRVYRAAALRRLAFDNDAFAFLPELLLRAQRLGLTLAEEPIHFVFRRHGKSKMGLWDTSRSYVSLLRPRTRRPRPAGEGEAKALTEAETAQPPSRSSTT
jgi:dolichol-phosphate mannosyltransferase